jgi:hypothetical protein
VHPDRTAAAAESLPLAAGQRYWLVMLIVPCVAFLVMVLFYLIFWVPLVGPPQPLFYPFLLVVLAFTGYDAVRAVQDLRSGTTIRTEDTIIRTWIGRRPGFLRTHGRLARLGRVRMTSQARLKSVHGFRHRVVVSPASKVVWSTEPLGRADDTGRGH